VRSIIIVAVLGSSVHAGGMFLPVRGVHALERGGALIAGADDAGALFDNPAGLAHLGGSGHQWELLVDGAFVAQSVDYARIDSGGNQLPSVSNQYPGIVSPTVALAYAVNDKLVVGAGLGAPYAGLHRYAVDGPQRYASSSLAESLFVTLAVGASYNVTPTLRLGVTVQDVISKLASRVTLSGCPSETVCAPEDPEFDADTKLTQLGLFAPSASAGVQWDAHPLVTLGAMVQAPARISNATGTLQTRLPSSSFFDGASVHGDAASLELTLPAAFKFGAEFHPDPHVRIEVALDIELWSMHDAITIIPHDVTIQNQAGVGQYTLSTVTIPRNYNNSYAPSIGGEYRSGRWQVGAGYSYETAAAPPGYVSVLTVDAAKHLVGLGGSVDLAGWEVGAAFGFVKLATVDVSLADAKVPQLSPIRDQASEIPINAGTYQSHYVLGGLRAGRRF
jgi:long-chain fatty acid transport protein